MTFSFDSGLALPIRTTVRTGIVTLLARLLRANGGYLESIVETSAIIRGAGDDDAIMQVYEDMNGRAPSVLVAVGDKPYSAAGSAFRWTGALDVFVYVFVNSMRSRIHRLKADVVALATATADPGTEVILEHVEELLIGQRPSTTNAQIKELRPVSETHIATIENFELWQQAYSVVVARSINAKRDVDGEIEQINTYHRLASQDDDDDPIVTTETEVST